MATLQNIRSKGPLLIIVIGLALFAFIAGDAWKVLQPHQSQDAGEVNGKTISVQEYQAMVEEYSEVIKFSNGLSTLTDEQNNQIKDQVWQSIVNNKLIETEAEKIGLTVTKQEIQSIISAGVHPMLQGTPFSNPQTGRFDQDMLKEFLVGYAEAERQQMNIPEYHRMMFKYWSFMEKTLIQTRLAEKYQTLIIKSMSANPVEAQAAFDGRTEQMDLLLAAIPYSSIPDSTFNVKMSEIKDLYNKRKEQYRQLNETRDIKYIDVQVTASEGDKAALQNEVAEYAEQLSADVSDYAAFVRSTGSQYSYVDLLYTKDAYPADVVARLDSVAIGEVYGPYYNATDNTLNVFKKVTREVVADSIGYRQIQVVDRNDVAKTRVLADSIYNALKAGASFEDLAAAYNQSAETVWISSANYQNQPLDNNSFKYISTITTLNTNEMANLQMGTANVILQVTNKKVMTEKYKVAVVKRTVDFSNETYNKAYNDFSQFIAANSTLEELEKNAEDAGYRLLERSDLNSSEHGIGGVKGTKDALRWAFSAKPGEVSGLYEAGENDRLVVVGLNKVNPEGYRSVESVQYQLRSEIIRDKKAEAIMADMKKANATTFDQYKAMTNAVSDTVKMVTFAAPAYVSVLRSSEPLVGAYAYAAPLNQLSAPIKGNGGVMVMQVYNKEKLNEEYDEKTEMANVENMHQRMLSRFLADLYKKANVKDTRYLFF